MLWANFGGVRDEGVVVLILVGLGVEVLWADFGGVKGGGVMG